MSEITTLVADNLDIWTGAIERKSGGGRGGNGKHISLYGIELLRALILDLAVRGKLVSQDERDEPAEKQLARIAKARNILVSSGFLRRSKKTSRIEVTSTLEQPPVGWRLTQIDELSPFSLTDGDWIETKDQDENGQVRLIQLADVGVGEFLDKSRRYINEETEDRLNCTRLNVGDVLIARLPNPIGRACLFPEIGQPAITAVDVAILRPNEDIFADYVVIAINSPTIRSQIEAYGKGATRFRVSTGHLKTVWVPLPPLAEQQRIVAKVDELMALCDALERESANALTAHQELVETLLATLVNSVDAADHAANWARLESHFDTLFTTEASIDALKQTILDLAVRGKLVQQNAANWPVEPLGKYVKEAAAGWSPKCIETPRSGDNWGVLKVSAVTWGRFQPEENKELPPSLEPRPEIEVAPGDFLISRANTAELVARSVVVPLNAPKKLMMSDKIIRLRFNDKIEPEYVNLVHASPFARAYYARVAGGTSSSMKNVSQAQIRALEIPIPTLAEQQSIVAKVDELMALCDALKTRLADAADTRRNLADAIVERASA